MEYTRLGSSGLQVSRITLGCMSYGSPEWRPWILDSQASRPFFEKAVELGINVFDTADMYSAGIGEEVAGRWLKEFADLDEVVIATKVYFPHTDGPNRGGLSRKHIQQAAEASLRRLGVDTIDLYQIHRLDRETPIEETLSALDQLVHDGKVRYIGASSMYAYELMRTLSVSERHGWAKFVSMQNHYNLIYREEEREMLPLCAEEGLGVMPWSPLARGMLAGTRTRLGDDSTARSATDQLDQIWYGDPSDWDVVEAVRSVAEGRGVKPAQIAIAWLLANPAVTSPIIGATKLEHLDDAAEAVGIKLSDAELETLEAPYRPHGVKGIGHPGSGGRR